MPKTLERLDYLPPLTTLISLRARDAGKIKRKIKIPRVRRSGTLTPQAASSAQPPQGVAGTGVVLVISEAPADDTLAARSALGFRHIPLTAHD
jgi:hypothetical protein